jgi:hypothetical protein
MIKTLFVIACAVLAAACSDFARTSPLSPTALPSPPNVPVATPPPPPGVYVFQQPYTEMTIGTTVQRTVDRSANPDCVGVPGYGCQYFRITPESDGVLNLDLTWVLETQPHQVLDLTLESGTTGQVWADFFEASATYLTTRVKAGETAQITVWYTFPGIEFSLQSVLHPN